MEEDRFRGSFQRAALTFGSRSYTHSEYGITDPDPNPATQLETDPFRTRIRNPASYSGTVSLANWWTVNDLSNHLLTELSAVRCLLQCNLMNDLSNHLLSELNLLLDSLGVSGEAGQSHPQVRVHLKYCNKKRRVRYCVYTWYRTGTQWPTQ